MTTPIQQLITIMARLRDPNGGCPWDIEQTFKTIAPYTIEEAYEVADAIDRQDMAALKDELGDLLLQVVYHTEMAGEAGAFRFDDVAAGICEKMIRRHPHVFGDEVVADAASQTARWEQQKAAERAAATPSTAGHPSTLEGIPRTLPALTRAVKLQKRAARVGFDWPDAAAAAAKFDEERAEFSAEIDNGADPDRIEDEVGDLLFSCINVARKLNVDPEAALRLANLKFERRFGQIEAALAADDGRRPEDVDLAELERLWIRAKRAERESAAE